MLNIPSGEDKISKVVSVVLAFLQMVLLKTNQYTFLDIGCGGGRALRFKPRFISQDLISYN